MQLNDEGDVSGVFGLYLPVIAPTSPPTTTTKAPVRSVCRCSPRGKGAQTLVHASKCARFQLCTCLSAAFSCRWLRLPGSLAFGGNDGGLGLGARLHALLLQP